MPTDTSIFGAAMKRRYSRPLVKLLPQKVKLWNKARRLDANQYGGQTVTYAAEIERNEGIIATTEGGPMPAAGSMKYVPFTIDMKELAGAVQFTSSVIERSKGPQNAFLPVMDAEMKGVLNGMANDCNRQLSGAGRGVLAAITTGANSATQTVRDPGGVSGTTNGNRYINKGMIVGIVNAATPVTTVRGSQRVTNWATDGTSITLGAAINSTTGDLVVRAGSTGLGATAVNSTAIDKEPPGILGWVDDGSYLATVGGLSRTTYVELQSTVIASVNALSADVIQRALDIRDQVASGEGQIEFWAHHSVRRAFLVMTQWDRRYMGGNLMKPDAGTVAAKMKEITFGDIEVHTDRGLPYGMLFGIDWSSVVRFVQRDGYWDDLDGRVLKQVVDGSGVFQDQYIAFYRMKHNFHCEAPHRNIRLDGISTTITAAHLR